MSRSLLILTALLAGTVGCQHTAGRCDCQPIIEPCCKYGLYSFDSSALPHTTLPAKSEKSVAAPKTSPPIGPAGILSLDGGL